jgi:hypothetical protein
MFKKDYKYSINYETEGNTDCKNHGCDDEGICRCFRITNVVIRDIDVLYISNSIFSEIFNTKSTQYKRDNKLNQILYGFNQEIDLYCIDRILRINKLWDPENWDPHWSSGYYGDEVDSIEISDVVYQKIYTDIDHILSLPNLKEKIEYILILEYGYLLEKIKTRNYEVIEVNKSDIIFGQDFYRKKVDKELEYYTDNHFDLIKGVCLLDDGKWRVIDGYHRLLSSKKDKVKIISIYENK